jgi:hypothetical protein
VSGNQASVGGVLIGTFAGGTNKTALVVTLNASATPARVQALLHGVAFSSTSENPSTAARTVKVVVTDGAGGSSASVSKTIHVIAVNDAPVVGGFSANLNYKKGAAATILEGAATVSDVDSADFAGGQLTISFATNGQATDVLSIRNQGTAAGQIGLSGSSITYSGIVIGTATGGTNKSSLVITLNASATPSRVQTLLRNITFRSTLSSPSTLQRTLKVTLTDGDGGTSASVSKTVSIV